jgi:hypothetical protein
MIPVSVPYMQNKKNFVVNKLSGVTQVCELIYGPKAGSERFAVHLKLVCGGGVNLIYVFFYPALYQCITLYHEGNRLMVLFSLKCLHHKNRLYIAHRSRGEAVRSVGTPNRLRPPASVFTLLDLRLNICTAF